MNKPRRYERIFWIETQKIKPNPLQPRQDFDEERLRNLADSIRHYGILQPLVVTRKEIETDSGAAVEYELINGERRLRAAQMAGLYQVPVIIHDDEEDKIKLELAIIENLQREDLNPIERAYAFKKLVDEFRLRHHEIASRVGKSREYVTNTIRLLLLPEEIQRAVVKGEISEGHCRPILMLSERKEEQIKFYQDIVSKKMNVRQAERISRNIAVERARKPRLTEDEDEFQRQNDSLDPEIKLIEQKLADTLGTTVQIERDGEKRRIKIEFFSDEELQAFLNKIINDRSAGDPLLEGRSDLLFGE
jgi:ParB family chromosome partitioning protein